jgi:hypothetical protein
LLVFVDDFKIAGPAAAIRPAWEALSKHVEMSGPKPIEKFLGCFHRWGTDTIDGKTVRTVQYDMCDFMQSCLKLYSDLIEEIKPGSSKAIQPAELPTDTVSGGGNAPAPKYGDSGNTSPNRRPGRGCMTSRAMRYSRPPERREVLIVNLSFQPGSLE